MVQGLECRGLSNQNSGETNAKENGKCRLGSMRITKEWHVRAYLSKTQFGDRLY